MLLNPLDWTAGPFLALYVGLAAALFAVALLSRSRLGQSADRSYSLRPLEIAYLAGGASRLGDAALVILSAANGAVLAADGSTITVLGDGALSAAAGVPARLPPAKNITRRAFQKAITPLAEQIRERLQRLGLSPGDGDVTRWRAWFISCFAAVLVLGIGKAFVGAGRGHPVGILMFLLIVSAFVGGAMALSRPLRTRAGSTVLAQYRRAHARAARAPLPDELPLAVALSGAAVLSGTAFAAIYAASRTSSSSSDGGGGGDGGSGCGGGGCGGCGS